MDWCCCYDGCCSDRLNNKSLRYLFTLPSIIWLCHLAGLFWERERFLWIWWFWSKANQNGIHINNEYFPEKDYIFWRICCRFPNVKIWQLSKVQRSRGPFWQLLEIWFLQHEWRRLFTTRKAYKVRLHKQLQRFWPQPCILFIWWWRSIWLQCPL